MMLPNEHKQRFFYHFTHLNNLESIIKNGILSTNEKELHNITHANIANENIQQRRHEMDVTCSPFGKIHDYVPFYLTTINPMLLGVLNRKNIDQPYVVFIAISANKLLDENVLFTDSSANTTIPPNFYYNPQDLDKLSWNLIDSMKWGSGTEDERHARMAEVLVYKRVPIEWIDSYIVYNDYAKEKIMDMYESMNLPEPNISFQPFNGRYFYFTKFYFEGRKNETLLIGPELMRSFFDESNKIILERRGESGSFAGSFKNITDGLEKISENFCVIKELEEIHDLETDNKVHKNTVSDHTLEVVKNLDSIEYYNNLSERDQELVKLSAYLHDIGKGPKSKWGDGIQKAYPDHPADAVPMIRRILIQEFEYLDKYDIRKICLLVLYHDLIGDILAKGRSRKELEDLAIDVNELNMLLAITLADISAINPFWKFTIQSQMSNFKKIAIKEICV